MDMLLLLFCNGDTNYIQKERYTVHVHKQGITMSRTFKTDPTQMLWQNTVAVLTLFFVSPTPTVAATWNM